MQEDIKDITGIKILGAVTTCQDNIDLYFPFEASFSNARAYTQKHTEVEINLIILDFTDKDYRPVSGPSWSTRLLLKGYGLPMNFNMARNTAITMGYDYLIFCNDDIILHEKFIDNGIFVLENNPDIGFLGGHSQTGGWNEDYVNTKPPEPNFEIVDLNSLARLNWEFSAGIFRKQALIDTGPMDGLFSPRIGLVSDNDLLYRMRRVGWRTVRSGFSTFWHSKARSQSKLRNPMDMHDPHRLHAVEVMFLKWGVDIRDEGMKQLAFTVPYNGEELEIIDDNTIVVGGKKICLTKV